MAQHDTTVALTARIASMDTDSLTMRRLVLETLAARTEQVHAERAALDIEVPDRVAAVVAVLDEASAYWALESRRSNTDPQLPPSVEEYREIAADTLRLTEERIPGLIADALDREAARR